MELRTFAKLCDLASQKEVDKARLLAYFFARTQDIGEFTMSMLAQWFEDAELARPNTSRLAKKLSKSRQFVKGRTDNTFRLHAKELQTLDDEYGLNKNAEIVSDGTILPKSLYSVSRVVVVSLAEQINASYERNIFDGCAVLMRRLLEILLILSYENQGIDASIRDGNGNYLLLERIIADAKTNQTLRLSRNTRPFLETFRKLGNFSAHKVDYRCRKVSIDEIRLDYRATIEELLTKAGLVRPKP